MKLKLHIVLVLICCCAFSMSAQLFKKKKKANVETTTPTEVAEGLNLGNRAPEIEMMDPAGQMIKLSTLRGKVVLIDFWASWCGPCRLENPVVVAAYDKYKDQKLKKGNGFTVYSVSLDMKKEAWQMAITTDKLMWPTHVSDLLGWNNAAAAKYGISAIPTNYLIDSDGIIIGKALRGEDLDKTLGKLIEK